MNKVQYVRQVTHHLNCSRFEKKRIQQDLLSDIDTAIEAGESWEDVYHRLGPAKELALELSENMGLSPKSSHRNLVIGIASGMIGVFIIGLVVLYSLTPKQIDLKASTNFDEAKVVQKAQEVITYLNQEDYQAIFEMSDTKLQEVLSAKEIQENWQKMSAGEFESFSNYYGVEVNSMTQGKYAVLEMAVSYSNQPVVFTISFDKDMKLAGFYMK